MCATGEWRAIWALRAKDRHEIRRQVYQIYHHGERDDPIRHGPIRLAYVEGEADEEQQQRDMKEHGKNRHDEVDLVELQSDAPVVADERAPLRRSGNVALVLLDDPSA